MRETVIPVGDKLPVGGRVPSVSIIVATLNAEKTLQRCIDSIATQTWSNKELIICDGGSKDRTTSIISANQVKVAYWCSEPDSGIYSAWNKGIAKATGDWVCFLGADDYFWNEKVLVNCMRAAKEVYPDIRVIYGQIAIVGEDGSVIRFMGAPWSQTKRRFQQLSSIPHPGLLCHRKVFEERGNFDESFRISGDYEFLLRELLEREAYFIPDLTTVAMGSGGVSSRSRTIRLGYEECRRAQKMHRIKRLGWHWIVGYAVALARWAAAKIVGEARVDRLANWLRESLRLLRMDEHL